MRFFLSQKLSWRGQSVLFAHVMQDVDKLASTGPQRRLSLLYRHDHVVAFSAFTATAILWSRVAVFCQPAVLAHARFGDSDVFDD